jgi:tetratricopeptide (TPR) repeat protein
VFFLSLILLLFTKAVQSELISQKSNSGNKAVSRCWFCFAFVLGLSFTNHMTTILLAPAFIYLYFYLHGFTRRAWELILWLIIPFIVGFSVYLYLPLRGSQQPIFNWGNPVDFERFFWHFSGRVYRTWIFASTESAVKQFNYFINSIGDEFAYFPVAFAVIGVVSLLKYRKVVLSFTLLLFFGCIFYSINYDIHDIDSYFLLAYLTIALWVGAGASKVVSYIKNLRTAIIVAIIIIISSFIPIFFHYNQVDESKNFIVEDYTRNMLKYIDSEGIIICYQWDYFISASYYLRVVEGVRPDVVIIDKELLRRSWYYDQLSHHYPWLIERSKKEIQDFLKELYKFEHNKPFDPNVIEYYYERVIKSIIEKNYSTRPIYATQEIEQKYTRDYNRIPSGLAFRLYNDKILHEIPQMEINFREPKINNIYVDGIKSLYAQAYMNNAIYLNMLGRKDNALLYLDKAIQIQPNYEQAIHLKDQLTR